jgi:hypothetical protein
MQSRLGEVITAFLAIFFATTHAAGGNFCLPRNGLRRSTISLYRPKAEKLKDLPPLREVPISRRQASGNYAMQKTYP